jgi:hypothetical protein
LAQIGIANAFANAGNLETLGTGAALATTPAGNGTVPQNEINTLANILADCTSTGAASSNGCSLVLGDALSGGATGSTPTDTATAAINIAHNPGANVAGLYGLAAAGTPFTPGLSPVPNDWTIAITVSGSGYDGPLAIDASGNVWIGNELGSSVIELSSLGGPLSGSAGFTGGGLFDPSSIGVDASGNVWIGNYYGASITELSSAGVAISPATGFTGGGLDQPVSLAIDSSGSVWTGNNNGTITKMSSSGTALSPSQGFSASLLLAGPAYLAIDSGGNAWAGDSLGLTELSNSGSVAFSRPGSGLTYSQGIAIDGSGNIWVGDLPGAISEFSGSGAPVSGSPFSGAGIANPDSIAIDGSGRVWIGNSASPGSISALSNSGAPLSPSTGFSSAALHQPDAIAVDGSGDLWVMNGGPSLTNTVTEFLGVATPVVTPLAVGVKSSKLGTRP